MKQNYKAVYSKDLIKSRVYYDCPESGATAMVFVGVFTSIFVFRELRSFNYKRLSELDCKMLDIPYSSDLIMFTNSTLPYYELMPIGN